MPQGSPIRSQSSQLNQGEALLYVSTSNQSSASGTGETLLVYDYDTRKLVRRANFVGQVGCSNKKGDVFALSNGYTSSGNPYPIIEYAPGARHPIRKLDVVKAGAINGCSIDRTTGNLAVITQCTFTYSSGCSGPGYVAIYKHAEGSPSLYHNSIFGALYGFCNYDKNGNLYIDALGFPRARVAELQKGSKKFKNFMLSQYIGFTALRWDGKHMAALAAQGSSQQMTIKQFIVSGSKIKIVGSTPLYDISPGSVGGNFSIYGGMVIVPLQNELSGSSVSFWRYPSGGTPSKAIKISYKYQPFAAIVGR